MFRGGGEGIGKLRLRVVRRTARTFSATWLTFRQLRTLKVRAFLKSTQLPKIYAPYALQMLHLRYRQNHIKGVSNVSYVREVRACCLTTYRHKAQDGIRYIVSKQLVLSMPDKNNTNRGQDVVFLTNTALRSRLRHKVLTRSRALSLPENTASDSQATKSSIFLMIFGKNERSCTLSYYK